MTDIECPQCGHRALSVATRCPRCGHEFPPELLHHRTPSSARGRRPRGLLLLLGGALAAVLAASLLLRNSGPRRPEATPAPAVRTAVTAARAGPTEPRGDSLPLTAEPGQLRYAATWVNVRAARGPRAAPVQVLEPGDSVTVDSLVGGWYRVVDRGRPVGYAHRRFLAARHPADPPGP
jgi:hypothetical protein